MIEIYAKNPQKDLIESVFAQTIKCSIVKELSNKNKYCFVAQDNVVLHSNCIENLVSFLENWNKEFNYQAAGIYSDYYVNNTRYVTESFSEERLNKGRVKKVNILLVNNLKLPDIFLHLPEPLYTIYERN